MANPIVREKLSRGEFFVAPGMQDMIAAVVANKVGFDIVYGTGYWLTASALGLPDAGLVTYTGYGGLLNVRHTVRGYEAAGVTAIQLEDQESPKKCGHTPFKRLIPLEDMVEKIKVAVDARRDKENFLIIARTDARQSEGLGGALKRLRAYSAAGADILFPEALTTKDEMRTACAALDKPCMANMADGGLTPILPADRLRDLGYAFAIYPSMTSLVAAAAMEQHLRALKENGAYDSAALFDFKAFCELIGFSDVWDFERRWAR